MTLEELQDVNLTIAGQPVTFHSCQPQGEGYAVIALLGWIELSLE